MPLYVYRNNTIIMKYTDYGLQCFFLKLLSFGTYYKHTKQIFIYKYNIKMTI